MSFPFHESGVITSRRGLIGGNRSRADGDKRIVLEEHGEQ